MTLPDVRQGPCFHKTQDDADSIDGTRTDVPEPLGLEAGQLRGDEINDARNVGNYIADEAV